MLVIFRVLPPMVTVTGWRAASMIRVRRFFAPFGRPLGLPLWPLRNRVSRGGLPPFFRASLPFDRMGLAFLVIVHLLETSAAHSSEVEIGCGVDRFEAVERVEPTDDAVDAVGIDLDPKAAASGFLGCDQGRAAAGKRIENDAAAPGAIENRVGYQG